MALLLAIKQQLSVFAHVLLGNCLVLTASSWDALRATMLRPRTVFPEHRSGGEGGAVHRPGREGGAVHRPGL